MVQTNQKTSISPKKRMVKRLTIGFAGLMTAAVVGSAGVAAAHPLNSTMYMPSRTTCEAHWKTYKFKSRAQCQAYWDAHKKHGSHGNGHHGNGGHGQGQGNNGGGSGYGGGNNTGVTVIVNGNNNVVTIIINYFRS
jgi:uncharacterized membrane protein YgcG